MKILFRALSRDDNEQEPLPDKMRRILQSHIDEAKTDEDREDAIRELRKFDEVASREGAATRS